MADRNLLSAVHFELVLNSIIVFSLQALCSADDHAKNVLGEAQILDFQPIEIGI